MRTTVTLDADAAEIIRQRMATEGVSFKRALNDTIRDGSRERAPSPEFATPSFAMGVPAVPLDKALQLAGDLEDDQLLGKMEVGK